jgi:hypothetical protein
MKFKFYNPIKIYSYKVAFKFSDYYEHLGWRIQNSNHTILYKDKTISMSSNYPIIQFVSTDRLTEKQIREDFHNSNFISKIEGDLRLPIKEALKTFKI